MRFPCNYYSLTSLVEIYLVYYTMHFLCIFSGRSGLL